MTAAPREEGGGDPQDTPFDSRELRRCLGQYSTGVMIVTARAGGVAGGMTANSFASVSLDPPLVLWSIQKDSASFDTFLSATHYAVNVLASDQRDLSQRFAKSGAEKFRSIAFEDGLGGAPVLPGSAAVLECRREREYEGGDHLIMVGRVERFRRADKDPLVFRQGRYALAVDHPGAAAAALQLPEETSLWDRSLVLRISRVHNRFVEALEEIRRQEDLGPIEVRLLSVIYAHPGRTLSELSPLTYIGQRESEDALAALCERRLVHVSERATLRATVEGNSCVERIYARVPVIEQALLEGVSASDLEAFKRVLQQIDTAGMK